MHGGSPKVLPTLGGILSNDLSITFGTVLREIRRNAGMTQEGLGLQANLQRKYISSIELGEKQPTLLTIFKLASALNISPSELIRLVEQKVP